MSVAPQTQRRERKDRPAIADRQGPGLAPGARNPKEACVKTIGKTFRAVETVAGRLPVRAAWLVGISPVLSQRRRDPKKALPIVSGFPTDTPAILCPWSPCGHERNHKMPLVLQSLFQGDWNARRVIKYALLGVLLLFSLPLVLGLLGLLRAPAAEFYHLRDRDNRIVLYHGVNVANCAKGAPGFVGWHTKEDFARLQQWGFNCVRYLVFWEGVEPVEGVYDEAYIDAAVERIRWMEELGLDVVIDFHQDLYSRRFTGNGFPDWTVHDEGIPFHQRTPWNFNYFEKAVLRSYENFWASRALKDKYIAMVEHFVRRIGALPNVAGVDVMNEPFPGLRLPFESGVLSEFYRDMQAMWRRNQFGPPMLFEPMMYNSGGLPTRLTFRPAGNCVFSPHYYDPLCHEGAGYGWFNRLWMRLWVRERVKDAQRFHTPLLYGEFGIASSTKGHLDYLADFLGLLDRYQASWTYYSYDKSGQESFGIVDNEGKEKDNLSVLVRAYPQRIAGDAPVFRQEGKRFDLTYRANDAKAPTVVFIPPRFKGVKALFNGHAVSPDLKTGLLTLHNEGGAGATQKLFVAWE